MFDSRPVIGQVRSKSSRSSTSVHQSAHVMETASFQLDETDVPILLIDSW